MMITNTPAQNEARVQEKAELLRLLPQGVLAVEPATAMRRWMRYKFMSPLECTRQFARDYSDTFCSIFGVRPEFQPELGTDEFVTLWNMRQSADQWRVPYPTYIEVSFSFNRKNAEKFRRPHMHFDRRSNSLTWRKKLYWAVKSEAYPALARLFQMPQYRLEHYAGLPAQRSIWSQAREVAKSTKRWSHVASSACIEHNVVSAEVLLKDLKDPDLRPEVIARLREDVASGRVTRIPAPALDGHSLLQTCFGWAHPTDTATGPCQNCPQRNACRAAASM